MPSGTDHPALELASGFSRKPTENYQALDSRHVADLSSSEKDRLLARRDDVNASPTRIVVAILVLVIGFAWAITSLFTRSGGRDQAAVISPGEALSAIAARVEKILAETPLIDGHDDLAFQIRYLYRNNINGAVFTEHFEKGGLPSHVDLPRLKKGKSGGAFWSAFVPCPANDSDFSDANYAESVTTTLSQLDLLYRLREKYADVFSTAPFNSSTAAATFREQHLLISPFGIEGLHQIGNSFSNLRLYHSLNVQYATLTHNCHNAFADAALVTDSEGRTIAAPPQWGGVSERGQVLVKEMNRIGMIVDLSHVSKDTMLDVLGGREEKWAGSAAPVIFSHSSAYSLCPHPRNVPDDILDLVRNTNSLVMVNFSPDFISCMPSNSSTELPDLYPPNATLHQVARHVMYIGEKIGFDHVGLGSDFDGIFSTPKGLEDVSKFPDLVAELLRMDLSDKDAAKVVGENILRVSTDVARVAAEMQREGVLPAEDAIEGLN